MPIAVPRRVQPPRAAKERVPPGAYAVDYDPSRRGRSGKARAPGILNLPDDVLELVARILVDRGHEAVGDFAAFAGTCRRLARAAATIRWRECRVDLIDARWRHEVAALRRACVGAPERLVLGLELGGDVGGADAEAVVRDAARRLAAAWAAAAARDADAWSAARSELEVAGGGSSRVELALRELAPVARSFVRLDCSGARAGPGEAIRAFTNVAHLELPSGEPVAPGTIALCASALLDLESIAFCASAFCTYESGEEDSDLGPLAGLGRLEEVRVWTDARCNGNQWDRSARVCLGDASLSLLRGPSGRRLRVFPGDGDAWCGVGQLDPYRRDIAEAIGAAPALRTFSLFFSDADLALDFATRMLGDKVLGPFAMHVSDPNAPWIAVAALAAAAARCAEGEVAYLCLEPGGWWEVELAPLFRALAGRRAWLAVGDDREEGTCILDAETCAAMAAVRFVQLRLMCRALVPDAAAAAALLEAARAIRARGEPVRISARFFFRDPAIVETILEAAEALKAVSDRPIEAVCEEEVEG